jgi:hypothetical protein
MQWLCLLAAIVSVWWAILDRNVGNLAKDYPIISLYWPFGLLVLFGVGSVSVIIYRVYMVNDCPEASKELQEQIIEAKADLKKKGLTF